MLDKLNKGFAQLAKIHAAKYCLIGGFSMAVIFVYIFDLNPHSNSFAWIGYSGLLARVIDYPITRFFYKKYELGGKNIPISNDGMVLKDEIFYSKITSNIHYGRKIAGYVYVLLRVWVNLIIGFLLFTILFLGIKEIVGTH